MVDSRSGCTIWSALIFSVYIGKFRGRKVAISEFREHLSESELPIAAVADKKWTSES